MMKKILNNVVKSKIKNNSSNNYGITLISLVVIIIILLILGGIAIATLTGENGLFARAKQAKENYSVSSAKEKLQLAISDLMVEQTSKGENLTKEDLPKINNNEIDVKSTETFPVEVICENYIFNVDENFTVTYVREASGTVVTFTTEPESYTNKNEVKILVKISNPKGIKSIQKPGETDRILAQGQKEVGIDYKVTKNGHYIFTIVDEEGKETVKDIYIDLIDKLVPLDFTPEIQKDGSNITIIENGQDAESNEISTKSGIDHYEYYLKSAVQSEYTKYDTNKIEGLATGKYSLYIIAYDRAGNSTRSNAIDFRISVQFKEIEVGGYHVLALDNNNNLWAWGRNENGQLGNGTTANKARPSKIETDITFVQISAGYFHSAGIDNEGKLWTWGNNFYGQLGDGTATDKMNPIKIMEDKTFKKVIASEYSTVAIDINDEIWHFGRNYGSQIEVIRTPQKLDFKIEYSLISGDSYYLFLDNQKRLFGWGNNEYGQLGDGTITERTSPIQIKPEIQFIQVSAGSGFSLAIDNEGNLWSWGWNGAGELGDGTTTNKITPEQIKIKTKFSQIAAGGSHGLAIDNEGNLWSWGWNGLGQLGDGTTTDRITPIKITDGTKFEKVYAKSSSSFAIDINGGIWSWGYNRFGELGDGTTINRTTPTQIN